MNEIKERVEQFIKFNSLSVNQFEKMVGWNGIYKNWNKGIRVDTFAKIAEAFPELDMNWVLTGRGTMLLDGTPAPVPVPAPAHTHEPAPVSEAVGLVSQLKDMLDADKADEIRFLRQLVSQQMDTIKAYAVQKGEMLQSFKQ